MTNTSKAITGPEKIIEQYNLRVSSFAEIAHPLASEPGKELEGMLYEILDLQEKHRSNKGIYKACEDVSCSIINKLKDFV